MERTLPRRQSIHFNAEDADAKLMNWRGDKQIGWEIVKAIQHGKELAKVYYKGPSGEAYNIVSEIYNTGSDPSTDPANPRTAEAWSKLPEAIEAANVACERIMRAHGPGDGRAMKALWHADNLYFSLTEAESLTQG